jgi:hypothetical protein
MRCGLQPAWFRSTIPRTCMSRTLWIKVICLVAVVWLIAGGIIWWMNYTKPTPERLAHYLETHSVDGKRGRDREKTIEKVADQLNELSYEQRREMRMGRKLDGFFRSLSPDEQTRFLDLTLPTGFKQMMEAFNKMEMEAFNKMDPTRRRQFVDRALNDLKRDEGAETPRPDDAHLQKIVQQGLKSFYSDASADVKMDFAPIIEQMQKNLQFGGR